MKGDMGICWFVNFYFCTQSRKQIFNFICQLYPSKAEEKTQLCWFGVGPRASESACRLYVVRNEGMKEELVPKGQEEGLREKKV